MSFKSHFYATIASFALMSCVHAGTAFATTYNTYNTGSQLDSNGNIDFVIVPLAIGSAAPAPAGHVQLTTSGGIITGGNVGIGTTSPQTNLEIYQSSNAATSLTITTPGTQTAQQSVLNLITRADGNLLSTTANNKGWAVFGRGNSYTAGTNGPDGFGVSYWNGTGWLNALSLGTTGNVGIGTTEPTAQLHIIPSNYNAGQSLLIGGNAPGSTALYLDISGATNGYSVVQSIQSQGSIWGDLSLNPNGGYVSIGTTAAVDILQLNGNLTVGVDDNGPAQSQQSFFVRAPGHKNSITLSGDWSDWSDADNNPGESYRYGAISVRGPNYGWHPSSIQFFTGGHNTITEIDANGYMAIGKTGSQINNTATHMLEVYGTAWVQGVGQLSDARHKKNIAPLTAGLSEIEMLKPVTFEWKMPTDDGMKGQQVGFIAQDVEKVLPNIVVTGRDADKTKSIKYDEIIPVLTKAIQEQQEQIKAQKIQIDALEQKVIQLNSK